MRNPLDHMKIRQKQFGRYDPISNTFGRVRNQGKRPHQGWDLEARVGTSVYAIANGTIEFVKDQGDYGKQVCLKFDHGGRTLYAFYGHLQFTYVGVLDQVMEGDIIALSGKTGNAKSMCVEEEHLHFEIRQKPQPGLGLAGRIDPGEVLGYEAYACTAD